MGVVFALRGTATARYSAGGPEGMGFGNTAPTVAADAGALSGSSIQWAANGNPKGMLFAGRANSPNGRVISVLFRFRPAYTTAPAAYHSFWSYVGGCGKWINLEIGHRTAGNGGDITVQAKNESATVILNSPSLGAWAPTSGTWYDIVFTWDGTTTANSCKAYADAVLLGSATATGSLTASWTNLYYTEFNLGTGNLGGAINGGRVDEVVVWDEIIDPTSVQLESGVGSLNGASRTSLVQAAAYDGSVNLNGLIYSGPRARIGC
jgi:hypothetical protein